MPVLLCKFNDLSQNKRTVSGSGMSDQRGGFEEEICREANGRLGADFPSGGHALDVWGH